MYVFFALSRYVTKSYFDDFGVNEASNIPSGSAVNNARIVNDVKKTSVGFTPLTIRYISGFIKAY